MHLLSLALLLAGLAAAPPLQAADVAAVVKEDIIAYNLEQHRASLMDRSYRGEEGLLGLTPEAGLAHGLRTLSHPTYDQAKALLQEAAADLAAAQSQLAVRPQSGGDPDAHARAAAQTAADYNQKLSRSWNLLMTYRARLSPENDERLNENLNRALLERLLRQNLAAAGHNLRDALARFHDQCRGISPKNRPLSPGNVRFVNAIFNAFVSKAPAELQRGLDLDRHPPPESASDPVRQAAFLKAREASPAFMETLFELASEDSTCSDPLLFMALIRRESSFKPQAVSYVGAAGLTQIMPATGKDLGMQRIFMPDYFSRAMELQREERQMRSLANEILRSITSADDLPAARRARQLMQDSLDAKEQWRALLERYRNELTQYGGDDRFDPRMAIIHGMDYFCRLLKEVDYDISLALAAYNAGPHRVKQYAGIPPFAETITFRNLVLDYYKEYQRRFY